MPKWFTALALAIALTPCWCTPAYPQVDRVRLAALTGDRWLTAWQPSSYRAPAVWAVGTLGGFPRPPRSYADPDAAQLGVLGGSRGALLLGHETAVLAADRGSEYPAYGLDRVWADEVDSSGALVSRTTLAVDPAGSIECCTRAYVDDSGRETIGWIDGDHSVYRSRSAAGAWGAGRRLGPDGFKVMDVSRRRGHLAAAGSVHDPDGWAIVVGGRLVFRRPARPLRQLALAAGDGGSVVVGATGSATTAVCLTPGGRIRGRRRLAGKDTFEVAAAVDRAGRAIVVESLATRSGYRSVRARWLGPTCRQTRAQTLWRTRVGTSGTSPPIAAQPDVTVGPTGEAVLDFQVGRGDSTDVRLGFGSTHGRFRVVNAPIGAWTIVGAKYFWPGQPDIVADGDAATLAWAQGDAVHLQRWTRGGAATPPVTASLRGT